MGREKQEDRAQTAKWEQPEIEDVREPQEALHERQKWCRPYYGGCRPMADGGTPPGMCLPGKGCYPFSSWNCAPRRPCRPYIGLQMISPYCRPYGFNYGYGCFPRR